MTTHHEIIQRLERELAAYEAEVSAARTTQERKHAEDRAAALRGQIARARGQS